MSSCQFMLGSLQDTVGASNTTLLQLAVMIHPMKTLGERVRAARKELGMSRPDLVAATKIGYSTISEIERGGMQTTTKIPILARVLNVADEWLATGKGPRERGGTLSDSVRARETYTLGGPAATDEALIAQLLETTTPRTRAVLQRLAESARTGTLSEADVVLLGDIASRLEGKNTKG